MAHPIVRANLVMSTLCAGLLSASTWLIAACTDSAQAPTGLPTRTTGLQRMVVAGTGGCDDEDPDYDICEFCSDNPDECDSGNGEGDDNNSGASYSSPRSLTSSQLSMLNQAIALIDPDAQGGQCGDLLNFAESLVPAYTYDPVTPWVGYALYDPADAGAGDYYTHIVFGPKGVANPRQMAITLIHEAAHGMWNLPDGSGGPGVAEWWGQFCLR